VNLRKYKKKLQKDMFSKVEILNPSEEDVILLTYPIYKVPQRELYSMFKFVDKSFKKNKILALPDAVTLKKCRKEDLEKMIAELKETIENMQ